MSWTFSNLLKGQVTQTILSTLLESGGYRVRRLGVEELLPELRGMTWEDRSRAEIPRQLSLLPDLLVTTLDLSRVFLVEVKYRRQLTTEALASISSEVSEQQRYWPDTHTVVMLAETGWDRGFHRDHIRVVGPGQVGALVREDLDCRARWEKLDHLQHAFGNFFASLDRQRIADQITAPLRDLTRLDREEEERRSRLTM